MLRKSQTLSVVHKESTRVIFLDKAQGLAGRKASFNSCTPRAPPARATAYPGTDAQSIAHRSVACRATKTGRSLAACIGRREAPSSVPALRAAPVRRRGARDGRVEWLDGRWCGVEGHGRRREAVCRARLRTSTSGGRADFSLEIWSSFLEPRLHEAADAADAARTQEGPALGEKARYRWVIRRSL